MPFNAKILIYIDVARRCMILEQVSKNHPKGTQNMKLEIELCEDTVTAIAEAIAAKLGPLVGKQPDDDDDLMGGAAREEPKITLENVQDAIQKGVGAVGKDKVKAVLAKFKVKAGSDLDEADYGKFIEAVGKLKK